MSTFLGVIFPTIISPALTTEPTLIIPVLSRLRNDLVGTLGMS